MQIDDLTAGLSLSFLINLNTEQLQFESKILEVYPRRHTLLAQGVFTDDKIISFRGKGLVVDLIVTLPEDKRYYPCSKAFRWNTVLYCLLHRRKQNL